MASLFLSLVIYLPKLAAVTVIGRHLVPVIVFRHVLADLEQVKSEGLDLSRDDARVGIADLTDATFRSE